MYLLMVVLFGSFLERTGIGHLIMDTERRSADAGPGRDRTVPSPPQGAPASSIAAGARMVNDVWGVRADEGLVRVAVARDAPLVVMHNRAEPR